MNMPNFNFINKLLFFSQLWGIKNYRVLGDDFIVKYVLKNKKKKSLSKILLDIVKKYYINDITLRKEDYKIFIFLYRSYNLYPFSKIIFFNERKKIKYSKIVFDTKGKLIIYKTNMIYI